jgi:hypothetical protein
MECKSNCDKGRSIDNLFSVFYHFTGFYSLRKPSLKRWYFSILPETEFLELRLECEIQKVNLKLKLFYAKFLFFSLFWSFSALAQFDGPAGFTGSKAIHKDSSVFVNWAKSCVLTRGLRNISQPDSGLALTGDQFSAIGKAGENGVVSLGDMGMAILTFQNSISNGPGPDFAVFENAFDDNFLELAFVEVSSNGNRFVRFPAISNTQNETQIGPFDALANPKLLYNLAGKYRAFFGTPFDLEELKDSNGLDINKITHVRIIDVVGSIDPGFGSKDSKGKLINDPFPTPFPSGGFDLDAIGVIHQNENPLNSPKLSKIYPNPAQFEIQYRDPNSEIEELNIVDLQGKKLLNTSEEKLNILSIPSGLYWAVLKYKDGRQVAEKFWKP